VPAANAPLIIPERGEMRRRDLKSIATRLRAMGAAEISSRIRQGFNKRADLLRFRLGFSFHREPLPAASASRFFFEPSRIPEVLDILRSRFPQQVEAIVRQAECICSHRFNLLGYSDLDYGREIDWHFDAVNHIRSPHTPFFRINYLDPNEVGDPKVTWELSRHQHLVTLAKAYRLTQDSKFAEECIKQYYSWHRQNPYPMGLHWSSSLEVGFRSLSWSWVQFLLADCDVVPAGFQHDLLRAFSVNGRYIERLLSTHTSPNTHLLGEAVALFFLGTLCPQFAEARRWQQTGWRIVLEEAVNQIRADGFHFEQSTYYHVYALDFFLHARILAARNEIEIPGWLDQTLVRMLDVLQLLSQAGSPPSFGDDDGGRVFDSNRNRREHLCDPLSVAAVLFGRGDFKFTSQGLREETLWLVGPEAAQQYDAISPVRPMWNSDALTASGIYVMRGSSDPPSQLVIDAGPQGTGNAGHGHADALGINISANGEELLCDPGTFQYGGDGEGRRWFRSTRAHNTLSVDEVDQAQATGPFSWTALPNTKVERWHVGSNFDVFHASHNGYTRLLSPVTHVRWVVNFKGVGWLVRDLAVGHGNHALDLAWHLGPKLFQTKGNTFAGDSGVGLCFLPSRNAGWSQELRDEWSSPAYGARIPAKTIHLLYTGQLPAESAAFLHILDLNRANVPPSLEINSLEGPAVRAYSFIQGQARCGAMFASEMQPWTFLGWSTDADFLCYRSTEDRIDLLLACNASFVDWQSQRVWSNPRPVLWCEFAARGSVLEVASVSV
jgi:hypothetical protein